MRIFLTSFLSLLLLLLVFNVKAELNLELPKGIVSSVPVAVGQRQFSAPLQSQVDGLKLLRKLRGSRHYIEDPELSVWIRNLGDKLVSRSLSSTSPFYFLVSKSLSLNAFATEGGVVVINAGLILKSSSESEVAAVLSHEIAHVTQRHITRLKAKARQDKWSKNAALVAGMIASTKDPQAGQAILSTTIATMAHKQLSYTREAESEADREGLRILTRGGFNPLAMPAVLKKLEQFGDTNTAEVKEYLQNHPLTQRRVSDTLARAKRLARHPVKENRSFFYKREKLRALTNSSLSIPNNVTTPIKEYSIAQKLSRQKRYSVALGRLRENTKIVPEALLLAHLLNTTNQYKKAQNILQPLGANYSQDEAIAIALAESYVGLNQSNKAWQVLKRIKVKEQTSLALLEMKQKVAHLTKQSSQVYYASAQQNIRISNYKTAKAQLKKAIKIQGNTSSKYEMKQLLSLLDSFK